MPLPDRALYLGHAGSCPPPEDLAPECPGNSKLAVASAEASTFETAFPHPPEYAIDEHLTTRWSSEVGPTATLTLDLGSKKTFKRLYLLWELAHGADYDIETSDDGASWTVLVMKRGGDGFQDAFQVSGDARYLRLKRLDTGDLVGIPIVRERLTSSPTEGKHGWEGAKTLTAGGVHLGIDNAEWICQVSHGGRIMVSPSRNTMGWGFGHKIHVNDATYCTWAGETIADDTAFEIAVTSRALTPAEKEKLLE